MVAVSSLYILPIKLKGKIDDVHAQDEGAGG